MEEERMKGEDEKKIIPAVMAESVLAAVNSKSQNTNPSVCPSSSAKKTNTAEIKGRSCTGCLYYSSIFQADSRKPICIGLSRSLPNDPKIHRDNEGKSLVDFRYGCVGYSLYKDRNGQTSDGQQAQTDLPVCVGLEVLVNRRVKAADSASVPSIVHNKEDGNRLPQHRPPKPADTNREDFLDRFTRNATLVANGVAKNMVRVGKQIKRSLDDIIYPYRRPPK